MLPIRVDTWQHSSEPELLEEDDELLEDDEDELLEDDDELDEDDDELLDEELLDDDELDELGGMNPHSIQLLNVASTSDQRISRLPCTRAESW